MDRSPVDLDAAELADAFARRALSPVEVVTAVLGRVEETQGWLNAFCALDPEGARAASLESEKRWKAGSPLGPLDGVPVSIKDNIYVAGMPTRFGSRAIAEAETQGDDSPCVARLREAGAVIFGKTTLPDYAHKVVTDSRLTGITRNPWDPARSPGGSSGGASAAIAAGLGPLAVGTDGGGSIRVPAAWTGTFGLKPSFGRVPHHPRGAYPTVSHIGPMTRTVADAASMMTAMTQADARDWYALPADGCDYASALPRDGLKGLRIAISTDLGLAAACVEPGIAACIEAAFRTVEALGAHIEPAHPPGIAALGEVHRVHWSAFSARLAQRLGEGAARLDPSMLQLVDMGNALPPQAFVDSVVARGELGSRIFQFFETYDLLLAPVIGIAPPVISTLDPLDPPLPRFTSWANQTGVPAASLPCGLADGLPVGLQIVAGPRADAFLLSVCQVLESEFGTFRPPGAA